MTIIALTLTPLAASQLPPPDDSGPFTRVRGETAELRSLIATTAERSATMRSLLLRIESSDLTVYVRTQPFATMTIGGRIGFPRGASDGRMLIVELACLRSSMQQAVMLAHELQHAAELADAPWVTNPRKLAAYYRRIGEDAEGYGHNFETAMAKAITDKVWDELSASERTSRATQH
jgi:Asp-tRNA(Asn)/Glu-tRNA(Gln) amidotransferase A subunit family amidase